MFYSAGAWSAFANASVARRLDETSTDPAIRVDREHVIWTPARTAKAGVVYRKGAATITAVGRYQGPAKRRGNDFASPYTDPRPTEVGAWQSLDLKGSWTFGGRLTLEAGVSNAFDSHGGLLQIFAYAFDYRIEERSYFIGMRLK